MFTFFFICPGLPRLKPRQIDFLPSTKEQFQKIVLNTQLPNLILY